MGVDNIQNFESSKEKLSQIGLKEELLKSFEENEIEGGQEFIDNHFVNFTIEDQEKFADLYNKGIESEDDNPFVDYLYEPGFPITEKDINIFKLKFLAISKNEDLTKVKENVIEENIELSKEKETNNEKIKDLINELKKDYGDVYNNLKNKYPTLEGIDLDIRIIEDNYGVFLDAAKEKSDQDFVVLYEKLDEYRKDNILQLVDFEKNYKLKYELSVNVLLNAGNSTGEDRVDIIEGSFDKSGSGILEIDGNIITYGNQVVDIGKRPPEKYLKSENGYLIESSEIDYKVDREGKKAIYKAEKEIKSNNVVLDRNNKYLKNLNEAKVGIPKLDLGNEDILDSLFERYLKNKNVTSKIEELQKDINNPDKQKNLREEIQKTNEEEIVKVSRQNEELEARNEALKEKVALINDRMNARKEAFKRMVMERDKKAKNTTEIIQTTGFDLLPQSFTDEIIDRLNRDTGFRSSIDLGGGLRIEGKIDFSKGEFGLSENNSGREKELLAKLLNLMITGEANGGEEPPVNVDNVIGNRGVGVGNVAKFNQDLSTKYGIVSNGSFNYEKVWNNLKPNKDTQTEKIK